MGGPLEYPSGAAGKTASAAGGVTMPVGAVGDSARAEGGGSLLREPTDRGPAVPGSTLRWGAGGRFFAPLTGPVRLLRVAVCLIFAGVSSIHKSPG